MSPDSLLVPGDTGQNLGRREKKGGRRKKQRRRIRVTWITKMLAMSQRLIFTLQAPPVILENSFWAARKRKVLVSNMNTLEYCLATIKALQVI